MVRRQLLQRMVKVLPANSQRCIKALKNLQLQQIKHESEFYEEVYALQKKYQAIYQPIHDKRKSIVTGDYVPTDEESNWADVEEESSDVDESIKLLTDDIKKQLKLDFPVDYNGIPKFWLFIFKNTELLADMVQEHDEVVLDKLVDIKIIYHDTPMSYTLEFHFLENEHFTNKVLTKQYFLRSSINIEEPFLFEGPEIYKCIGCVINWNKGMNLTVKTIRKKQKHKAKNATRTVSKQVPNDSFFNFFTPPAVPEDITKVDIDDQTVSCLKSN